jgi:hypothetical protein
MKSNSFLKIFIAFLILLQRTPTNERTEMSNQDGGPDTCSSVMDSQAIEMYGAKHIIPWQQKGAISRDD